MVVKPMPDRQDNTAAPHDAIALPLDHETARGAVRVGRLTIGADVLLVRIDAGEWGLVMHGPGRAAATQARPARIEIYDEGSAGDDAQIRVYARGYASVRPVDGGYVGTAAIALPRGAVVTIEDSWTGAGDVLRLSRTVTVAGDAPGGFLSAVTLLSDRVLSWVDVDPFAPGMLYGWSEHVTGIAIGGVANYLGGVREVRIREDRLPAPLFGLHFGDGTSITVLDPAPRGDTTAADAHDVEATAPLIDERFRFGALGGVERDGRVAVGYWFPGTEGEVTYRGDTFPTGQMRRWRRRYHPIADGLVQRYEVMFRVGRDERFTDYCTAAWRWAWRMFAPPLIPQDIEVARRSLVAMLADRVIRVGDKAGLPVVADAVTGQAAQGRHRRALMGFIGRSIESAYFLLREADRVGGADGERYRGLGVDILESFVRIPVSPPEAEGFSLVDGRPCVHLHDLVYLRCLCEGAAYMIRAWRHERAQGRDHPHWLGWSRRYGDWLLTQEHPSGGFPRARRVDGGTIDSLSPESSYNAVPLLLLLYRVTGERAYLDAAIRAGEFCWVDGQCNGVYVGGTIDNPNVIDKEAGTVSLDAYLALYEATGDETWLWRGRAAGDFAETWMYLWNVPMAADDDDASLHWKKGVSTVGLQLIASGHSLVDAYMAWDVASYAKLYRYTGDAHYLDVARLLLHNTKAMLALPGHTYDLAGPGWQQEHWSLAPRRGYGIHRYWLPWVSCSHLWGIESLEEYDPALFAELAASHDDRDE